MKLKTRYACGLGCVLGAISGACSDAGSSAGAGETADETNVQPPVRSSCGDMPILDDRWKDTTDECKACVDTQCCAQAQACADNPDCKALWECRAKCEQPFGDCLDACNLASLPFPPENAALINCRNSCAACMDTTTCKQTPSPAPSEASYAVRVHIQSYTASAVPFAGVTLKVCERSDVECAAPISQGVTDADGNVEVDVPSSPHYTDAYFEVTGPNVQPTRAYYQVAKDAAARLESTLILPLLDSPTASALSGAMQATADPASVGLVTTFLVSCGQRGLSGMTVESSAADATTILQYSVGAGPSAEATMTSGNGVAIFADHPAGPTTITARVAETGEVLGAGELYVRAGFLNSITVWPMRSGSAT